MDSSISQLSWNRDNVIALSTATLALRFSTNITLCYVRVASRCEACTSYCVRVRVSQVPTTSHATTVCRVRLCALPPILSSSRHSIFPLAAYRQLRFRGPWPFLKCDNWSKRSSHSRVNIWDTRNYAHNHYCYICRNIVRSRALMSYALCLGAAESVARAAVAICCLCLFAFLYVS